MRRSTVWGAAGLIALALVLTNASLCLAAITEREVMDRIHDSLAVLRYHYQMKADAEYNLELCRAAKVLTEKQLATEQALLQAEKSKVETLETQNLTRLELLDVAKTKLDILQKQGVADKDLKALTEAERTKLADLLKPNALKQEDLTKQLLDEKAKLLAFFQKRGSAENDMFDAGKTKMLAVVTDKIAKEKNELIEAEKARVRDLLKRKDVTAQDLLDMDNAMLDYLARRNEEELKAPEAINARGQAERVAAVQTHVDALQRQLRKLASFDYEKVYSRVMVASKAKIDKLSFDLDAQMTEYEVLFGKKAAVEIAWETEMAKYHPKRESIAYFVNLD